MSKKYKSEMDVKILYRKVGEKPRPQWKLEQIGEFREKMIYGVGSLTEAKREFRKHTKNARIMGYETS